MGRERMNLAGMGLEQHLNCASGYAEIPGWVENASEPNRLAESNVGGSILLTSGTLVELGTPLQITAAFAEVAVKDVTFEYQPVGGDVWNSLEDQTIAGWQQANPDTDRLEKLDPIASRRSIACHASASASAWRNPFAACQSHR